MKIFGAQYIGFNVAGVTVRPSAWQWAGLVAATAGMATGIWRGKFFLAGASVAAGAAVLYSAYEDGKDVRDPALMNGYFITEGEASASQGNMGEAAEVRQLLGLRRR